MAYELAPLPYDYAALEPFIDAETMKIHHDKHHQAYVNNLNAALASHPELAAKPVDDLLRGLAQIPEEIRTAVRNNGGGHSNHTAFWKVMGPVGSATLKHSRRPSTRPRPSSSAPAGAGWFFPAASSRWSQLRTRTRLFPRVSTPFCSTTSGSMPTTSNTRIAVRITSPPGGT